MDEYTEWCHAVDLDPEEDSSRDAYNDALVAHHELAMLESDLEYERMVMDSAIFYDDDYGIDPAW